MSTRQLRLAAMVGVMLLGFALRLYNINRVSLRGDEAFTVLHWMREPLSRTLAEIATVDPQPPLAYALYRLWALVVGSSEYVVRFLPALLNLIGIPAMYALGKQIGGVRFGLVSALLWAVHPAQIWHAQDARNYAIWGALSPLALWLALRALRHRGVFHWLLYVGAALLAAYVYYLELFFIVALNLYVIISYRRDRSLLVRWFASQVAVGLLLAPWYLQERLLFGSGYGGTADRFDLSRLLTWLVPSLAFGDSALLALQWWPLVVILLVAGWFLLRQHSSDKALFIMLLGVLPLFFLSLVSIRLNVFVPRYVLPLSGIYVLVLSSIVLSWRGWYRGFQAILVVCVLVLGFNGYQTYYSSADYAKSPDWRSLTVYLQSRIDGDATVVQRSADIAFNFYYQEYVRSDEPFQLPANPRQSAEEITSILESQDASSYWLLAQPPSWDNASVPLDWLNDYTQLVDSTNVSGLDVRQYLPWAVREIDPEVMAAFGNVVELVGAQTLIDQTEDAVLSVWLYWRPLRTTETPLKVFVHLIGDTNPANGSPLWSQDDDFPQAGRVSTSHWTSGMIYRDIYTLPLSDVPTGTYQVVAGFYDPQSGARLPAGETDHLVVGTITLTDTSAP